MAKSAASNTTLVGTELFKSEVTKVLLAEKDRKLETCQFKLAYEKQFGKQFNHQKYGFLKKKLTGYFDDVGDVVSFENERKFIVLKEKASVSQNKPTPSQVSSSSESLKDGNRTNSVQSLQKCKTRTSSIRGAGLIESTSKSATDVKEKQLVSRLPTELSSSDDLSSGIERFKAKAVHQVKSLSDSNKQEQEKNRVGTETFDSIDQSLSGSSLIESLPSSSPINHENSRMNSCGDRSTEEIPNSELESYPKHLFMDHPVPSTDSVNPKKPLSGVNLFKSEVKQLLLTQPNYTLDVGRFKSSYKAEFNSNFSSRKYGFTTKKVSKSLENILDVVILENIGSSLFMKLKDKSDPQAFDLKPLTTPKPIDSKQPDVLCQSSLMSTPIPAVSLNTKQAPLAIPTPVTPGFQGKSSKARDSGLPATTMTTGLQATTMTTGLQAFKLIDSKQPDVLCQSSLMSTPIPAVALNTKQAPLAIPTPVSLGFLGKGFKARVSGLPATTMTTSLQSNKPVYSKQPDILCQSSLMLTPIPAVALNTKQAPLAIPTPVTPGFQGKGFKARVSGLQATTMTTGLQATTIATPITSSKKMVPSLESIMKEQKAQSLEEPVDFPSLPAGPSPSTKPRHSKMRNPSHDVVDEQRCLDTPGPFEESFKYAYDTPLASSSLKKSASTKMSSQEINEIAKQVWESISADGEHVSLEIVKVRLCKRLGVKQLNELGYRKPDIDIPVLKDLSRLLCKLDLYCRAYVMVHSISTLSELGQGMARLLDKKDFLDLQVGPLVKLPVVYDLFKAPSEDVMMHQVTTVHILKHLNQYLTKKEKWTSKVDLQDFMQYLCDRYQCSTPYELGVRIQSIGLGISMLKRAQKSQSEKSKEVEQELAIDMEREIEKRCRKIKDDLLGSSHGDERSVLHKLLGSSVVDILTVVFNHCKDMFKPKSFEKVNKFLNTVTSEKSFRDLFNLALHMGCKDIVKDVLKDYGSELLEEERKSRTQETALPPKKGQLIKEAKDWLNGAEKLDLSTLATIETRLLNRFSGFDEFSAFGYGTWLEFLNSEKELCKLLEDKGVSACGGSRNSRHEVDLNSVLDFIIQCGTRATEDLVEHALCSHYHVPSVTDLGAKSYKTLAKQALQRKHIQQSVVYELALVCKDGDTSILHHLHPNTTDRAKPRAGLLGWKNADDAVRSLASAPLLADMKEWTQWDAVFKPCLGDLKLFIAQVSLKKRDDGIQLQALETEEGRLLKVNTDVSPDDLKKSVDKKDVIETTGILVSLVIKYGGIQATPLALIVNHMRSALLALASTDQADDGQRCARFVLHCLCRLPHRICVAVASKVFLEPLGAAVGTTLSNQLVLSCCDSYQQRSCLHRLGLSLGHTEWIEDFKSVMTGETENQALEEERKKIFQELRPVAIIKPVTAEPIKQEEVEVEEEVLEKEDTLVKEVILEEDQVIEFSAAGETPTPQGAIECSHQQVSIDEEEEDDNSEQNPCEALIESIRKEEFGIGVTLGEEESKLVQKQREREGRSLHRLSSELYSRDTHFVLELIQNADDNTFTTDSPTLVFVIEPHMVVVLNNEVGFKEENIRALCDVGKSTKGAHQYGYIGQKGIGFKSVFRVSDRPEVHSNGYHICFDANSGPSGYILPHWIDDHKMMPSVNGSQQPSDILNDLQLDRWMTRIVLPLKEEFHGDKKNSLSARFNDVHPSLLLFLHRLRKIILAKKNKVQQMTRQDLGDDIVEISDGNGTNHWLVVKKQLKVKEARENVEMTELALAFPMTEQEKMSSSELHAKPLPVQNVFAYLPLRSYGFKFIIQGDFEVPSSREDVDSDKAWNQWLREEIPRLFVDALEVFKNHPHFPGLSGVTKFFQFVPLKEEILDFFTPVAEIILRYLQGMDCLPVTKVVEDVSKQSVGSQYDWMQPCRVVVCEDPDIVAVISPELLYRHLALHYLAPDLISTINPALREELGITTLSVKHLIDVGRSVIKGDLSGTTQDNAKRVQWISQWLCCVYRCLEREHNSSSEILEQIAALNIFPLSDYTFVNLRDNAIFFPLSTNQQTMKQKKKRSSAKYLQELEKDLLVLNPELLDHLENVGHSQVEKLLQQLGVKSWTAKDVIHNHILPTLKSDKWKEKTNEVLQCYLVYVFTEHMSDRTLCDLDELKGCAQVLTNKGPVNPSKTPVHFTSKYGNHLNLSKDIPSISWTLISDCYLHETPEHHVQEWEKFFSALGVQHFLAIERRHVKLSKITIDSSPWAPYYESWPKTSDGVYVIEDFCCDELDEFMSKRVDPQQAKVVAENLDKQWTNHYSKYAEKIPLKDGDGKELYGHSTLSSFLLTLKTKDWLPVLQSNTCSVPSELYLNGKEVYDVLDDHVQYVGANLQDSSFARTLGITSIITLDNLLHNLIEWSKTSQSKVADQGRGFVTSLAHMKRVYQFVHEKFETSTSDDKSKITSVFQKNPLIFFPHDSFLAKEKQDQKQVGEFHHKKEVCWKDPSDVTHELVKSRKYTAKRQILSTCYSKYYDFFKCCLEVDLTPHSDEYIEMASVLVNENPVPTPSVLKMMIEIFAVLGGKCLKRQLTETNYTRVDNANYAHTELDLEEEEISPAIAEYLKSKLATEDIFPCATRWVSLSVKPVVADDKSLKKVFEQEKGVHFIVLEHRSQKTRRHVTKIHVHEKKMGFVQVFLRACGIPKLSACVEESLTTNTVAYQCPEVQQYFHQIVPCVQRYIYHLIPELYSKLVGNKFPERLAGTTFAIADKLEVVYHLRHLPQVTVVQQTKWGHENHENKIFFYAVSNQMEIAQPLNREIAKLFGAGGTVVDKKFENFLELLRMNLENDLETFLFNQDVESLPEEEEKWYVPAPEIPESPEIVEEDLFEPVFHTEKASSREYENDGALHSWPPRAPVSGINIRSYPSENRPQEKSLEMWPEPEPPNSIKNQITTDKPLPLQTNKHPAESSSDNNDCQTTGGVVFMHDVGTDAKGLVSHQHKPEITSGNVSQQKTVALDGSVQKDPTNPQIDLEKEDKASGEQPVQASHLRNTVKAENVSTAIFTPDMKVIVQDLEFENLPTEDVCLPDVSTLRQNPNKDEIGRWGEEFVYEYLKYSLKPGDEASMIDIQWINEKQNSVAPYDIEIREKGNGQTITFIEVKSTSGEDKEHFEISAAELKFAIEQRDKFHLYRVFNACSRENIRIQRVKNLAVHLENKSVKLFMIL